MIFHKLNDLLFYFLFLIAFELILFSSILIFDKLFKRYKIIKKHIFFTILLLSIFELLIFKIDWDFVGENKDGIITGKGFILLLVITNVLNSIMLVLAIAIENIKNRLKIKNAT